MLKISSKLPFPTLPRVTQKTFAHCGPAVLEMLLDFQHIHIDQNRFVTAAAVKTKLKKHGMNIHDLGAAVVKLVPRVAFWFKENTTVADLVKITKNYKTPVGVEWQGVFGKYSDGDDGHYGIVIRIDRRNKTLTLIDPFPKFGGDRTFKLTEFTKRWWDYNQIKSQKTGKLRLIKDHRLAFIITSQTSRFPRKLRMKQIMAQQ